MNNNSEIVISYEYPVMAPSVFISVVIIFIVPLPAINSFKTFGVDGGMAQ